jgi:hypothetical protein
MPPLPPGEREAAPRETEPAPSDLQAPTADMAEDLLADSYGTGYGAQSAAPNMIGDFFGGSAQRIVLRNTVPFSLHVRGFLAPGSPGGPGASNAVLIYEAGSGPPNDFTTAGPGVDASGDTFADTFPISEPIPPNDSPVSPGPGFVFDGGTAVFTNTVALTTAQDGVFQDGNIWFATYSFSETLTVEVPAAGGAVVRRVKLCENNSPIPRDRLFWNYNFFNNVPGGFGDISRCVFGFEKTFRSGGMSMDVRFPFASTVSVNQIAEGVGSKSTQFGNLTAIWKSLMYEDDRLLFSGGCGVAVPTSEDTRLYRRDGRQILRINNDAVHLLPFVAMLWTPGESGFFQGFLQLDVDTNGNAAFGDPAGVRLPRLGTLQDATYMFLDMTAGYWLYQNEYSNVVRGIAPVIELHYSTTLQDTESLTGGGITISSLSRRFDVLNLTAGTHVTLANQIAVTAGLSVPLRSGDDQQFDIEAMVLANWYF